MSCLSTAHELRKHLSLRQVVLDMSSSNIEEMTREKTHGRKTNPTTCGGERKEKSCDIIASMEARLTKVDACEGMDLIEQG